MTETAQLTFDLGRRPRLDRGSFIVGAANREALAWIDLWPEWVAPSLVLQGTAGAGKSHLAAIWADRVDARQVEGDTLTAEAIPALLAQSRFLVVDHAETAPERPLLHLLNAAAEGHGGLLLLARTPPARWRTILPDLRSRLLALPLARILAPDDALIRALLEKHFADRQIVVAADVVDYLLSRMERSFARAADLANRLDRAALVRQSAVTVPLARRILEGSAPDQPLGGTS